MMDYLIKNRYKDDTIISALTPERIKRYAEVFTLFNVNTEHANDVEQLKSLIYWIEAGIEPDSRDSQYEIVRTMLLKIRHFLGLTPKDESTHNEINIEELKNNLCKSTVIINYV